MKKEFVNYNQALALKELGFELSFDESGFAFHSTIYGLVIGGVSGNTLYESAGECLAPLKQQVFRWFRDKYKYVSEINVWSNTDGYSYSFKILTGNYIKFIDSNDCWSTYEEAESACIDELIKIIKNKKDEKNNNTDNNSNSRLHL